LGSVIVPARVFPERVPEKFHACSTPGEVAFIVRRALFSIPVIATLTPQFPVPLTLAVESVSDESARVIDTAEHCTPGSVRHPVHAPATENVSATAGSVVDVDVAQPARISADAVRATADRFIFKVSTHSSIELFAATRRIITLIGSVAYPTEKNMFIPSKRRASLVP
jgi:hypothetical protein